MNREKALVKLNRLSQQLADRRKRVESSKKTRDLLRQLKSPQQGPAKRVANALKSGDMEKAMQELRKLSDKLRSGDLTEKEKEQLAKQLKQIQKDLEKLLDARQQLLDKQQALQQQINRLKKEGKRDQAGRLQQKMDQLQNQIDNMDRQNPQLRQLQSLCSKLGNVPVVHRPESCRTRPISWTKWLATCRS